MAKFKITDIKGVIPAMITCFDKNEEVDVKRTEEFTEYLIAKGAEGLYITGSTGEGFLMTNEERKLVTEVVCRVTAGRVPVIVHVGDIGTKKSIDLAKHAEACGADAISSVPPFYYKFNNEDIYNYYKDISDSVEIPMIVYNISLAGLMGKDTVRKIATIKGVQGLKFTALEHFDMAAIKREQGKDFMVYSGCDEMAISGILHQADGIIGSFYNMMPEIFIKINNLCKENNFQEAYKVQEIASRVILFLIQWDFFPIMRECLRQIGMDAGYSRRPFKTPTADVMEQVYKFFDEMKAEYGETGIDVIDKR